MASDLLTTIEAAKLAGVGPSTVKRWADHGLVRCVRTAGGHRRFERFALERFIRNPAMVVGGAATPLAAWLEPLLEGRRHAVDGVLLEARARLGAWYRVADELGAFLAQLGEEWTAGRLSIAEEHLVAEGLSRALGCVGQTLPTWAQGPRCVLACVEGEEHTLGLSLAELCLVEDGWTPVWLGARTPAGETIRMVQKTGARMVALSASAASNDAGLLGAVIAEVGTECSRREVDLVLGGDGAWPEVPAYGARLRSFSPFHQYLAGGAADRRRRAGSGG